MTPIKPSWGGEGKEREIVQGKKVASQIAEAGETRANADDGSRGRCRDCQEIHPL